MAHLLGYMNDLSKNVSSTIRLFADDIVIGRVIHIPIDQVALQNLPQQLRTVGTPMGHAVSVR